MKYILALLLVACANPIPPEPPPAQILRESLPQQEGCPRGCECWSPGVIKDCPDPGLPGVPK